MRHKKDLIAINLALREKIKELSFLQEVLVSLTKNYNYRDTIEAILDMAISITGSEAGFVVLGTGKCNNMELISTRGDYNLPIWNYLEKNKHTYLNITNSSVLVLTNTDPEFSPLQKRDPLLRSLMVVPLKADNNDIGMLILMHRHHDRDHHRIDYTKSQRSIVMSFARQAAFILDNTRLKMEYHRKDIYFKTITALISAIDAKDTYTRNHSRNVAGYAVALGAELGLSPDELVNIHYGAILHDVGKIGIPENILNKPDCLTPEEFQTVKAHPAIGANILAPIDFPREALNIVHYHHERFDGSGYPAGLKGESIPYAARIAGIADAWDAMTSDRSYRQSLTVEKALGELQAGAGGQFDPVMVNAFSKIISKSQR